MELLVIRLVNENRQNVRDISYHMPNKECTSAECNVQRQNLLGQRGMSGWTQFRSYEAGDTKYTSNILSTEVGNTHGDHTVVRFPG